jgi:cell division protein FtsB
MIEGLKIENKKLKEIVSVLEKQVKELKKDNKILAEDNARRK